LIQPTPVPDTSLIERIRTGLGRRTLGLLLALLIELLLLLMLLSLGPGEQAGEEERRITVVNFNAEKAAQIAPAADSPAPEPRAEQPAPQRAPEPQPAQAARPQPQAPAQPPPSQPPPVTPPLSRPNPVPTPPAASPPAAAPPSPGRPSGPARPVYGPPNPNAGGGGGGSLDTERVGTAPNGEPLYAAAWHTRPRPDQLRGYLATANGPGWGLIACRTAPGFRVEDCVALDEYPAGSQINRAVLAAAWEFKVRPPRIGGRSLVGSWVRIRIDYGIERR
jgi:protein TonB